MHSFFGTYESTAADPVKGGNDPRQSIPIHPGYQLPFARRIRHESSMATAAVSLLHSADLVESVLANGDADLVVIGRALLAVPTWSLRAAAELKSSPAIWPIQYERSNIF